MVAELAAAATLVAAVAGKMVPYLLEYLRKNHKLREDLKRQIDSIACECHMICALIEEDTVRRQTSGNGTHQLWITMVRDLAYEIDDTIDRFTQQIGITLEPDASWIHRTIYRVNTRKARNKFAAAIVRLRKKSVEVSQLKEKYSGTLQSEAPFPAGRVPYTASPVGMDMAGEELMELIRETPRGQPEELRVISLVGFGGIGKSQLAKYVYDSVDEREYPTRAWVRATEKGAEDVLNSILQQLGLHSSSGSGSDEGCSFYLTKLCASFKECLGTNRFLIVIDDIQSEVWEGIEDAFPVVPRVRSRVIVTKSMHSIAKKCSQASGDVYEMRTLDEHYSSQLLIDKASLDSKNPPLASDIMHCSEAIKKCDGLPLALVTTGQLLQSRPNRKRWPYLCKNLGRYLVTNRILARMKCVLVRTYTSLSEKDVKTCLLYLGIYPSGRPIRRGSLIRRWLAEGFITEEEDRDHLDAAFDNFDVLIDHSIIQPIDASGAEVKTCQTHGMMLEFVLHNTDNFVTFLGDKATIPSNVRWLSLHAAKSKMNLSKLRLVRSLTIFGEVHKSALDFSKYKLMRVLDLEECDEHLEDKHLNEICSNLSLLRYLSLRGAARVKVLPKEIEKLLHLETLDVRRTSIEIMPTEVMQLPCLVHLFGKLKIQQDGIGDQRIGRLQTWLSENSKLEKLAGFVVDERQEMPRLIEHMENLTKVKIWCESTPDVSMNISPLSKAIKGFVERSADLNRAHSLSLTFNSGWPQDLLCFSLKKGEFYYLSSLKLQGNIICSQLPLFVTNLCHLTKLCLSFPGNNLSSDVLDALKRVCGLGYLKLIATQLDKLVIREGELEGLQSLCIIVEVMTELVIGKGALQRLNSLQLLCKDLRSFSSTTIQSLPLLKEVFLHDELSEPTKQEWKKEAKMHPRRPKVFYQLNESEPAAGTSTGETATDTITQEVTLDAEPVANSESLEIAPDDLTLLVTMPSDAISTGMSEESVQFVTSEMGSKSAAAATDDLIIQVIALEREPVENSETPAEPQMDMPLSTTMSHNAISNGKSVPVATSAIVRGSAENIPEAPSTTNNTTSSMNHDAVTNAQQDHPTPAVTSERSEPAAKLPWAPATTDNTALSMNHDAINAQAQQDPFGQVDGDDQHDDHKIEDLDTDNPYDFASENTLCTDMASFKKEMEGVVV